MRARSLLSIGITGLVGAAASVACTIGFAVPTVGYTAFAPYGSCATDGYAVAVAVDCPGIVCPGDTYYAICDGVAWTGCDCTLADLGGYVLIPSGVADFSGAPGGEGGVGGGSEGGGGGSEGGGGGSEGGGGGSEGGGSGGSEGGGSGGGSEGGGGSGGGGG